MDEKYLDTVYPINLMVVTRGGKDDMRTCFGIGDPGDPQFTLSAAHEHGVCYAMSERQISMIVGENIANTVVSTDFKGSQVVCYEEENV